MEYLLKIIFFIIQVIHHLLQWFSKSISQSHGGSPDFFWGGPPAQSYFPNNTKALFAVFTFANLTVGKIAGALAGIKAVALNCTSLVYHLALEIKI